MNVNEIIQMKKYSIIFYQQKNAFLTSDLSGFIVI